MRIINLYTTLGCHLCEQAEAIAQPIARRFDAQIRLVDIADSDALMARYGVLIPVLNIERTGKELNWPFTAQDVEYLLQ